jgi:hypothetical protein
MKAVARKTLSLLHSTRMQRALYTPIAICLRLRVLIVCSISREHLAAKITKQEQSPTRDQSIRISAKKTGELAAWLNILQILLRVLRHQRESARVIREKRRNADKSENFTLHRLRVIKTSGCLWNGNPLFRRRPPQTKTRGEDGKFSASAAKDALDHQSGRSTLFSKGRALMTRHRRAPFLRVPVPGLLADRQ